MENTMEDIEKRLVRIEDKLDYIIVSNNKLDKHIDFIEQIYSNVKKPLNYISKILGGDEIEYKSKILDCDELGDNKSPK